MLRARLIPLLLGSAAALVGIHPFETAAATGAAPAASAAAIQNEPLVVYSVNGGTLSGLIHRQLTVYNSGFATIAKADQIVFPTPGEAIDVQTASVGAAAARKLLGDLVDAGAVTLPDQQVPVPDVPLTTLTIAEGKEIALSRTFSYYVGPPYSGVSQVINRFITANFPAF